MYLSRKHGFLHVGVPRTGSVASFQAIRSSDISDHSDVYAVFPSKSNKKFRKHLSDNLPNKDKTLEELITILGLPGERDSPVESTLQFYYRNDYLGPIVKKGILLHHMTPSHLVKLGVITEGELASYYCWGLVRDPLERWLSGQFLIRKLAASVSDAMAQLVDVVRSGEYREHHPIVAPYLKDYFFHEGQQVVTPFQYDNLTNVTGDFIETFGGRRPESVPIYGITNVVPEAFKEPMESWFPSDCIEALTEFYAEDYEFYNSVP